MKIKELKIDSTKVVFYDNYINSDEIKNFETVIINIIKNFDNQEI